MDKLMNDAGPKLTEIAQDFYAFLADWQAIGDVVKAVLKALYDGIV